MYEKDVQTLGNMTANRIKRLFYMVKAAMRGGGKTRERRMHLRASIHVLMAVISYKTTIGKFMDHVNTLKVKVITTTKCQI